MVQGVALSINREIDKLLKFKLNLKNRGKRNYTITFTSLVSCSYIRSLSRKYSNLRAIP